MCTVYLDNSDWFLCIINGNRQPGLVLQCNCTNGLFISEILWKTIEEPEVNLEEFEELFSQPPKKKKSFHREDSHDKGKIVKVGMKWFIFEK